MEKRHTIRMSEDTAKRLKKMAALAELTQGDLLKVLLEMRRGGSELAPDEITEAAQEVVRYLSSHPQGGPR